MLHKRTSSRRSLRRALHPYIPIASCRRPISPLTALPQRRHGKQPTVHEQLKEERSPAADEFYNIVNKHSDLDVGICKDIDIANILLFLASDESRVITGQAIDCDCGCYL